MYLVLPKQGHHSDLRAVNHDTRAVVLSDLEKTLLIQALCWKTVQGWVGARHPNEVKPFTLEIKKKQLGILVLICYSHNL